MGVVWKAVGAGGGGGHAVATASPLLLTKSQTHKESDHPIPWGLSYLTLGKQETFPVFISPSTFLPHILGTNSSKQAAQGWGRECGPFPLNCVLFMGCVGMVLR